MYEEINTTDIIDYHGSIWKYYHKDKTLKLELDTDTIIYQIESLEEARRFIEKYF